MPTAPLGTNATPLLRHLSVAILESTPLRVSPPALSAPQVSHVRTDSILSVATTDRTRSQAILPVLRVRLATLVPTQHSNLLSVLPAHSVPEVLRFVLRAQPAHTPTSPVLMAVLPVLKVTNVRTRLLLLWSAERERSARPLRRVVIHVHPEHTAWPDKTAVHHAQQENSVSIRAILRTVSRESPVLEVLSQRAIHVWLVPTPHRVRMHVTPALQDIRVPHRPTDLSSVKLDTIATHPRPSVPSVPPVLLAIKAGMPRHCVEVAPTLLLDSSTALPVPLATSVPTTRAPLSVWLPITAQKAKAYAHPVLLERRVPPPMRLRLTVRVVRTPLEDS